MKKHLAIYQTTADYEADRENLSSPYVVSIAETATIIIDGREYVNHAVQVTEEQFAQIAASISANIGSMSDLAPEVQADNIIASINKLATLSQKVGDLSELQTEAKDNLVNAVNEAATKGGGEKTRTYTKDDWDALSSEDKESAKAAYDTIYITGDVSDWCEKPAVSTYYPADCIPKDNTIYELGVRSELVIAGTAEHSCASITVTAAEEGMTLGIAEGIGIIGSLPGITGGKTYFIGIADGMLYINEVTVSE